MKFRVDKLLFASIVFASVYHNANYWRSVWFDPWYFVMMAATGSLGFYLSRKTHWSVGCFYFYVASSALWAFGWRTSYDHLPGLMPDVDILTLIAVGKVAAYTFASLTSLVMMVSLFEREDYKTMETLMAFLCFANSVYIIYQAISGRPSDQRGGLFGNPSISGCLIGFTFPFLCLQPPEPEGWFGQPLAHWLALGKRGIYLGIPVIAVLLTRSSQPVGVLGVVILAWASHKKPWVAEAPRLALASVACVSAVFWAMSDHDNFAVFSDSGRFTLWKQVFPWWWNFGSVWFGQGTGVTQLLAPIVQKSNMPAVPLSSTQDWWLWLHSDWLQMLLENGVLGALLGATMYAFALVKSYRKADWLFAATVGIGACGIFNFPVHFPVHAFCLVVILGMCFHQTYMRREI